MLSQVKSQMSTKRGLGAEQPPARGDTSRAPIYNTRCYRTLKRTRSNSKYLELLLKLVLAQVSGKEPARIISVSNLLEVASILPLPL